MHNNKLCQALLLVGTVCLITACGGGSGAGEPAARVADETSADSTQRGVATDVDAAAQERAQTMASLTAEAKRNGAAAVWVSFKGTFTEDGSWMAPLKLRAAALLAELGPTVWSVGRHESYLLGSGGLTLYLTEAGVAILKNSHNFDNVGATMRIDTSLHCSPVYGSACYEQIDQSLLQQGYVDLVVTMNVDGLEYDLARDGSISYPASMANSMPEVVRLAGQLLGTLEADELLDRPSAQTQLDAMASQGAAFSPQLLIRVNRKGLIRVMTSNLVRAIWPRGYVDKEPMHFDEDAIAQAQQFGVVEVMMMVRDPLTGGSLSTASHEARERADRRALNAVLTDAHITPLVQEPPSYSVPTWSLSVAELRALQSVAGNRLLEVRTNRPLGWITYPIPMEACDGASTTIADSAASSACPPPQ